MRIEKLIYVATPYKGNVIIESQVYQLLEYYVNNTFFNEVILIQIYANLDDLNKSIRCLDKYTFKKIFIKGYIGLTLSMNPIIFRLSKLFNEIITDNSYVIHVRTEILGYHVVNALIRNKQPQNVLIDIRGTTIDEINFRLENENRHYIYLNTLKYLYKKFPVFYAKTNVTFSAVSEALKQYLICNDYKNNIEINPNIACGNFEFNSIKRNIIREKLNIKENQLLIVLSSGNGEVWQKDKTIINNLSINHVILNLSKEIITQKNVINIFLPFEDMPDYLSAADVAIVWRDNHILNKCSSPSKFSEFARMGLFIIHNGTVDLITKYINDNKSGIVIDNIEEIYLDYSIIQDITQRELRIKKGKEMFGVEMLSRKYYNLYCQILEDCVYLNKNDL